MKMSDYHAFEHDIEAKNMSLVAFIPATSLCVSLCYPFVALWLRNFPIPSNGIIPTQ
jgi:hypothetical protein